MSGLFLGLEIGLRSLRSHQQALNVTAHNVANSNAPGYTRQQALLQATVPETHFGTAGQVGTGVQMHDVARMRDAFLDTQLRNETGRHETYSEMKRGLDEIQSFFNEPSDNGLQAVMNEYWSALSGVANEPESDAARRTVIAAANTMADAFAHIAGQLTDLGTDVTVGIDQRLSEANSTLSQIRLLNEQIRNVMLMPAQSPNDLKDQRDLLVDRLTGLINCGVSEREDGMITLTIGGQTVLSGTEQRSIAYAEDANGSYLMVDGVDILGSDGALLGGAIGGCFGLRDTLIAGYLSDLDTLAQSIIQSTNAVHRSGWGLNDAVHTERDFFSGSGAKDIAVSAEIAADPSRFAASASGQIGDGSCAHAMWSLQTSLTTNANSATFSDFYHGLIGRLGVKASEVNRTLANQRLLIKEIETHRQNVQGVSVDEELTNMVRFQHAYNAAARLVTAVDEMLETVINRMGLSGR